MLRLVEARTPVRTGRSGPTQQTRYPAGGLRAHRMRSAYMRAGACLMGWSSVRLLLGSEPSGSSRADSPVELGSEAVSIAVFQCPLAVSLV